MRRLGNRWTYCSSRWSRSSRPRRTTPRDARSYEWEVVPVGAFDVPQGRRAAKPAVQAVRPCMVRARDGLVHLALAGLQQLVPAVAADVRESSEDAVVAPDQQDALPADL